MFDASRLGNHSAQIELIAIKAKHEVPNGRAASGCCRRCVYCRESSSSRVVLSVPSDLAEGRIQVLSDVVCGGSAVEQGRAHQSAGSDQPAARAQCARHSDGGGSGLSCADIREHRRGVRPARHDGQIAREHCGGFPKKIAEDPIIAKRLGDTGQIMSVLGPAQFGARVQEQRDKLAALAKTLGVKATQ